MIHLDDQRYWLYAAVDPATNQFLHVRLFPTRNMGLTERFLRELREKHAVDDAEFLVDSGPWLKAALFQEVKHRTYQFENFSGTLKINYN